ncbi:MAG: type I 3-dehydroquinate dehydratase [Acidobacteriota bacterium]|jgi:3-dehydroquinate dehydratase/shikimate dehydrogenase
MSGVRWPYGGRCRVCVSLAEPTHDRLLERFDELRRGGLRGADLAEVRLDALNDGIELSKAAFGRLIATSPVPLGFTLRPTWQGGAYDGGEQRRREILARAAAAGPGFIDVELTAEWATEVVGASPAPVVLSHHWYEPGVPPDLDELVARATASGAAMIKLVASAASPDDAVPLLAAGAGLALAGQPTSCFCMGEAGRSSRLLAAARGAALIYAAAESGAEVAPGQWTVRELVDVLGVTRWRPGLRLFGLVGDPIGHSLSPAIFNAVLRRRRRNAAYVPLHGGDLDAVLRLAKVAGVHGVSVTMPFKESMAARSSVRDRLVEAVGAANTVVFGKRWSAHNTDAQAVVDALAAVRPLAGTRVALLGAGGAARGAAAGLVAAGCRVTLLNRTVERARRVAERLGLDYGAPQVLDRRAFDIVINATPVGMTGTPHVRESPVAEGCLHGEEIVLDMVYRPRRTVLLRQAAAAGCVVIDGLEMFVRQAAAQYRLLTGDRGDPPLALMRATAEHVLGQDKSK